jgi:hypothetical protein
MNGDPTGRPHTTPRRVPVVEAAVALGITEGAVRMRVKRGTLPSTREGGRLYVLLDTDPTTDPGRPHDREHDRTAELIATLREQLQAERQAHAEARRIIAGLVERIPALEAPADSAPNAPGSPEAADQQQGRGEAPQQPQAASSRPWWRRVFR